MDETALFFFREHMDALPIYQALEKAILEQIPETRIKVQTSQISFYHKRLFCCASFLRARKKTQLPDPYLTVTFGLGHRQEGGRICGATEPYPGRWTHHAVLASPEDVDGELMAWIREAAAFSTGKSSPGAASNTHRGKTAQQDI